MLFTDGFFLFYFLPLALVLHRTALAASPGRRYPGIARLILFSLTLIFYGWRYPWWIAPFLIAVVFDFVWARLIQGTDKIWLRRTALIVSVVQNLALLALFKYRSAIHGHLGIFPEVIWRGDPLPFPAGISFYTFESLSFVIDVYRGKVEGPLLLSDFLAFIGMFPRFIAGPITRFPDISRQFREYRGMDLEGGLTLFIWGLFLKACFADQFAVFVPCAFGTGADLHAPAAWLGVVAFAMQLYFDFAGYSLMAIGLGRCFGFRFPDNFDRPYLSRSLTDFWRRWHRTLSFWFRDYLYIPLGGNQGSRFRVLSNIMITMIAAGVWHGAGWTFAAFGLWNGIFLCLEKLRSGKPSASGPLSQLRVLAVFWGSLVFFRASSLGQAVAVFRALITPGSATLLSSALHAHLVSAVAALCGLVYCFVWEDKLKNLEWAVPPSWRLRVSAGAMLLISFTLLFSSTKIPFLYFQF